MKMINSIVANAKIVFAIFIHLHFAKIRDNKNVKNIARRRKMSFLLNRCVNN